MILHQTLYFDKVEGTKIKGFEILGSTGADGRDFYTDDEGDEVYQTPFIIVDFAIESDWLPGFWQEIYMYLADCTRHEMEHIHKTEKILVIIDQVNRMRTIHS